MLHFIIGFVVGLTVSFVGFFILLAVSKYSYEKELEDAKLLPAKS
jgi:hypothetical protein